MFWQKGSVSVVIRFVTSEIPTLQSLSLPPVLSSLVMEKRGLILVVGATGSGKSTTLASMLDFRNQQGPGHILTIEDPIEYVFTPKKAIFNQREVGNDTLAFHEALRNAMRQAPDCILIGEIRDQETMRMALTYALSGHLCLSTLHANNAYQAMNRVISFFPLEVRPMLLQDLAVSLKAIISQRLVKTIEGGPHARDGSAAEHAQRAGADREGRGGRGEGGDGKVDVARLADLRAGPLSGSCAPARSPPRRRSPTRNSATNLGLLLGNSGIMPMMSEKAKQPSRPGGPSFGDFKISEETEEKFG